MHLSSCEPLLPPQGAAAAWDSWTKGTQKNDVTSLSWTEWGRLSSAGPNWAGPLLEWGQGAWPPRMSTSASTLCPRRCPLDRAPGQCGP